MSANHQYNITPEKQASLARFFYNQLTVTPTEVRDVDLQGKTAIVTGANSGVGFESSRQLLDLGLSKLILAVRSEEKGKAALAKLSQGRTLDANAIEVWLVDFSDYSSVVSFAERTKSLERLDIVILSVGIFPASRKFNERTKHDEMIQVNYLSTALLIILLLPVCKAKDRSQPARITLVSSEVSAWTSFKERNDRPLLSALDKPGNINLLDRMMVSKLLGQLFLAKLAKLVPTTVAIINSASPAGLHDTEFGKEHEKGVIAAIGKSVMRRIYYSSAVGSRTVVDAAVKHGKETHGEFFSFQKIVPMAPLVYSSEGQDIRDQLWKETMAELSFAQVETILKEISM
ncbi:hypothetical protein COCC4DRAFT_146667 [Bipolaris maydis ATCC 48331]|uniref:Uncharacterized protein n=2 Tax=Cochliobolus heterostrophus TaxID=5016 RepID=M2THC0_COCH5|nr:uncharacterized protein COCC4DRAFT_146667 [Bipolaris maydis ATCC 48331]EMD85894.1 hypothetical protein COCHEDRAFT_1207485 [Bipolaris maydis C5]KAH7562937.1 hypothetical protein BM1_02457 [Bipolaris maydis]EMD93865.1 hypothetical protein COCHEDRAFT_1172092 [Bipolaris maydis C5]ENI01896.1 hypothetical protein COCC4DRAFT_146667 [Bipolaris maydis ATCC 48331]KAJ5028314.1 hypothetical protein J3E73DRAFT_422716 [Bipolaris maydis]